MNFDGYSVTHFQDSVYSAFKKDAVTINGIKFSHHFYFQYCRESHDDDYVNGKACVPFKPSINDNYYMAIVNGGNILSIDLQHFVFQPTNVCYMRFDEVEEKDFTNYHNVDWE